MAVTTEINRNEYIGDGIVLTFQYKFRIIVETEVEVLLVNQTTGNVTEPILNTDYTVTGVGNDNGGNIVFVVPPPTGTNAVFIRDLPETQQTVYPVNGPFPAKTHETALDRAVMLIQKLTERVGRTLRFVKGDDAAGTELPIAEVRKGKFLGFDATTGDPIAQTVVGLGSNKNTWLTLTNYLTSDLVKIGSDVSSVEFNVYVATTQHTSGVFLTDLGAGKWKLLVDIQGGMTATNRTVISAADTTAGFLDDKIVGGDSITTTILNPAGDEDLEIKVDIQDITEGLQGVTASNTQLRARSTTKIITSNQVGLVPIATSTSTGANISITGMNTDFKMYKLMGFIKPVTDDVSLFIRATQSGTPQSGASDYAYNRASWSTTVLQASSGGAAQIDVTGAGSNVGVSNSTNGGGFFEITIFDPSEATRHKRFIMHIQWSNAAGTPAPAMSIVNGTFISDTDAIDGIDLSFSSGNITELDVTLYGIAPHAA